MKVPLAYGKGFLPVEFPEGRTTVIQPSHVPGLKDERAAVLGALENPISSRPLREWIKSSDHICIIFTDITRATPNDRLIPWLLAYIGRRENIALINALGTHRPNSRDELERLLTPEVVRDYDVLNHEPENSAELAQVGVTRDGTPALLNRHALAAD